MPKKKAKPSRKRARSKKNSNFYNKFTALSLLVVVFLFFLFFENFKSSIFPSSIKHQSKPSQTNYLPEIIEHGPRDKKEIALTFDADMTYAMIDLLNKGSVKSWYNQPIIDYLKEKNVKATVFFTGLWTKVYPKEARAIAQNSLFEIGNHSYSHPGFTNDCYKLPSITDSKDAEEIENAQQEIINVTGVIPQFFRFPGGCSDSYDLETVSKLGLRVVHWDVVSGDAFDQNTEQIVNNIEHRVKNGSIIVMHLNGGSYAPKTYFALMQIIPELQKKGFTFVKISELLNSK